MGLGRAAEQFEEVPEEEMQAEVVEDMEGEQEQVELIEVE